MTYLSGQEDKGVHSLDSLGGPGLGPRDQHSLTCSSMFRRRILEPQHYLAMAAGDRKQRKEERWNEWRQAGLDCRHDQEIHFSSSARQSPDSFD